MLHYPQIPHSYQPQSKYIYPPPPPILSSFFLPSTSLQSSSFLPSFYITSILLLPLFFPSFYITSALYITSVLFITLVLFNDRTASYQQSTMLDSLARALDPSSMYVDPHTGLFIRVCLREEPTIKAKPEQTQSKFPSPRNSNQRWTEQPYSWPHT
jgi:hypothetical protein